MRNDDRVRTGAEYRLAFFEPIGVAPPVAEPQRIGDCLGQLDPGEGPIVKGNLQAQLSADPKMMAAVTANIKICLELAIKEHLLAAWAFLPEVFWRRLFRNDAPDLWQHEVGEPVHRRPLAGRTIHLGLPSPFGRAGENTVFTT